MRRTKNAAWRGARAAGVVCAAELLAVGIDFSFAPVADLRGRATVVGDRAFAADPGAVAALAGAFAGGLATAGMGFCGKHFPGHGFADADSHLRAAVDARGRATILRNDIIPFAALCADARRAAMMTAHVRYPRCDAKIATYSEFWIQKMLREKLGFRGLVVADDLSMAAAAAAGPMAARLAAAAAGGRLRRDAGLRRLRRRFFFVRFGGERRREKSVAGAGAEKRRSSQRRLPRLRARARRTRRRVRNRR